MTTIWCWQALFRVIGFHYITSAAKRWLPVTDDVHLLSYLGLRNFCGHVRAMFVSVLWACLQKHRGSSRIASKSLMLLYLPSPTARVIESSIIKPVDISCFTLTSRPWVRNVYKNMEAHLELQLQANLCIFNASWPSQSRVIESGAIKSVDISCFTLWVDPEAWVCNVLDVDVPMANIVWTLKLWTWELSQLGFKIQNNFVNYLSRARS
jgi:hypothetical protein